MLIYVSLALRHPVLISISVAGPSPLPKLLKFVFIPVPVLVEGKLLSELLSALKLPYAVHIQQF